MNDDGVLQGHFSYKRHGRSITERMGADTAAWIIRNGAGVPNPDPVDGHSFTSLRGSKLWWWTDGDSGWWRMHPPDPENVATVSPGA